MTAPDGSAAEAENLNRGKLRSTFDLQLKQSGTYRVAVVNDGVFARWKEDGKPKRYFGKPEGMAQAVPAKADELEVSQSLGRVETFVTAGKPSAVKPVGRGWNWRPSRTRTTCTRARPPPSRCCWTASPPRTWK